MSVTVKQPVACRELNADELALIDTIKAKEAELLELHAQVVNFIGRQDGLLDSQECIRKGNFGAAYFCQPEPDANTLVRHKLAEPRGWARLAKTDIQRGIMALVRAIEQPVT